MTTSTTKTIVCSESATNRDIHLAVAGNKTTLCGAKSEVLDQYDPQMFNRNKTARSEATCVVCKRKELDRRVKQLPADERKALRKTEAWIDSHERALELWVAGFRPMEAQELKRGMIVAYRNTDIFQMNPIGPVREAQVHSIMRDDDSYELIVVHSHGETEADIEEEVWAK